MVQKMKRTKPRVYAAIMRLGGCASIDEISEALGKEYSEIEPMVRRLYRDGELVRIRPNVYCATAYINLIRRLLEEKLAELCRSKKIECA